MKTSHIAIIVYLVIGLLFAIYGNFWGDYDYKGFAYNLGRGLVWPHPQSGILGAGRVTIRAVFFGARAKECAWLSG